MNILVFFVLTILIESGEALQHLKSIKGRGNITYDCFEIYKQPTLNHPLLKHHKVQLKPSRSASESEIRIPKKGYKKKTGCPKGTVPILRPMEDDVMKAEDMVEKHFISLASQNGGQHIAGMRTEGGGPYRGVGAEMNVFQFPVGTDESSFAQAFVGAEVNGELNYIQAGWMINPSILHDIRPWSFGYWKGKEGMGCFNTMCQGFVQISKDVPLSEPEPNIGYETRLRFLIHQDQQTGNWWITQLLHKSPDVDVGYWPKELFNLLGDGASTVGFGGLVYVSSSGHSPPMGNANYPSGSYKSSAFFSNLEFVNSNYLVEHADKVTLDALEDSVCYQVTYEGYINKEIGDLFLYGGPGGDHC